MSTFERIVAKFLFIAAFVLIQFTLIAQTCTYVGDEPALFEPPNGEGCYLMIGQNHHSINDYYEEVGGPKLAGATQYTNSFHWGIYDYFYDPGHCETNFIQDYVDNPNYDNTFLSIGYYFSGEYAAPRVADSNEIWLAEVREFAQWIKALNRPVFLRIGFEPEHQYTGYWDFYKQTWWQMVDVFREEGVTNCAYVWQVSYGSGSWEEYEPYYPGDDYVDWFGFAQWEGIVAGNILNYARDHGKPVMVCESAPHDGQCSPRWDWFTSVNSFIKQNSDVIKAWTYINYDWINCSNDIDAGCWPVHEQWGSTEIQANEQVKTNWLNTIVGDDHYIKSSTDLFLKMNTNWGCSGPMVDCNGDENGTAYFDNCDECVGGNTALLPCEPDCNGDYLGTAVLDNCNECVGGNTGEIPCIEDCSGEWGGIAFEDICGNCVSGSTGNTPCLNVSFIVDELTVVVGDEVTFTNTSTSTSQIVSYSWTFGSGASVASANTAGPHTTTYSSTGTKTITLDITNQSGTDSYSMEIDVVTGRSPYGGVPHVIPGIIEFEDYDEDGAEVAFHETDARTECEGIYRNDDVEICDANNGTGGYVVAYTADGEWMEYTVNVETHGLYSIKVNAATGVNGAGVDVLIDGVNVKGGKLMIPITDSWDTYEDIMISNVELEKGNYKLIRINTYSYVNLDYLNFELIEALDCNNELGGSAAVDACGVCSGGSTGLNTNETCTDCNNDLFGYAFIDSCGFCAGGNTQRVPITIKNDCLTDKIELSETEMKVYPNPNNGSFIIQLDRAIKGELMIIELSGKVVKQHIMNSNQTIVNVSNLKQGVYTIHYIDKAVSLKRKLLVY